jgi:HEPN domain-containing protein
MKHRCVALALLAAAALPVAIAPASADEPDIAALLEDAKPVGDRWEQCAAAIAKAELRSRRPADDLAERALAGCKREEAALKSVLRKEIGPERAETVTGLVRDIYRTNLIRAITTIRER